MSGEKIRVSRVADAAAVEKRMQLQQKALIGNGRDDDDEMSGDHERPRERLKREGTFSVINLYYMKCSVPFKKY